MIVSELQRDDRVTS